MVREPRDLWCAATTRALDAQAILCDVIDLTQDDSAMTHVTELSPSRRCACIDRARADPKRRPIRLSSDRGIAKARWRACEWQTGPEALAVRGVERANEVIKKMQVVAERWLLHSPRIRASQPRLII